MVTEQEIIQAYHAEPSLRAVAAQVGVSYSAIRRVLISAGEYTSPRADEINRLADAGRSVSEIAQELGCSEKTVSSFLPYSRGSYAVGEKSENAKRIHQCRMGKT